MAAVLKNPLKLLTGLFSDKTRARKALNRARERQAAAQREVNEYDAAIRAATVPDPAIHRPRLNATKEQLAKWREGHAVATAELAAATAEVAQAETALATLEQDLTGKLTLTTVKASYREAVSELDTANRELVAIRDQLRRAENELAESRHRLTCLTADAVQSQGEEYRAAMAGLTVQRDAIATAELMVNVLQQKETRAIEAIASAMAAAKEWEGRLWQRISEEQFAPAELAAFGERILTAYAAKVASGDSGSLHRYLLELFAVGKLDKGKIEAVRTAVAKEHGIAAC